MSPIGKETRGCNCEAKVATLWVETDYQMWLIGITRKKTGETFDNAIQTWNEETEDHGGKTIHC